MAVHEPLSAALERRHHARFDCDEIQCRAIIYLGRREYAGYLHNISQSGAKLRTIMSIGKIGELILKLPELPPLHCELRWNDFYNAGVGFTLELPTQELSNWLMRRKQSTARCCQRPEIAYMARADILNDSGSELHC